MKREEISFLVQLVRSLEGAEAEMENAYSFGDYEKFNRMRKFIIEINKKISEVLR